MSRIAKLWAFRAWAYPAVAVCFIFLGVWKVFDVITDILGEFVHWAGDVEARLCRRRDFFARPKWQ